MKRYVLSKNQKIYRLKLCYSDFLNEKYDESILSKSIDIVVMLLYDVRAHTCACVYGIDTYMCTIDMGGGNYYSCKCIHSLFV